MYKNGTRDLPYITCYADAHKYFEGRPKPPRSRKWHESQRPLKDTRSYHYRIERGQDDSYYDLVLYQTVMARYWAPDAEGNERRQFVWHGSQTSRDFMWNVVRRDWYSEVDTTDGRRVMLPIMTRTMKDTPNFSTDAWFTPRGLLMVDKSKHVPIYRRVSSSADKEARAQAKKLFEPLFMLAAMRLPEFVHEVVFSSYIAGEFKGFVLPHAKEVEIRDMYEALRDGRAPTQAGADAFMMLAHHCFSKIASDRAYAKGFLAWKAPKVEYSDIEPVTEAELVRSLWNKLQQVLHIKGTSGFKEYPQFPTRDEVVLTNITVYGP